MLVFLNTVILLRGIEMIEIDQELCCGCNYCTLSCGQESLSYINYRIVVDPENCELCGACIYYCPNKAIKLIRDDK